MNRRRRRTVPRPRTRRVRPGDRQPTQAGHSFVPGETTVDWRGDPIVCCAVCNVAGGPDDPRHRDPDPPDPPDETQLAEYRAWVARRWGETDD